MNDEPGFSSRAEGEEGVESGAMKIKRALLSVSDKSGIAGFARGLVAAGAEILSTGGTAAALREAGVAVTDVSAVTGFPEILGGRVKTLHPAIHGGILRRRGNAEDDAACAGLGIGEIDLVCVDLYPFERAPGIERIDIGGPTMLRAAAKNHESVVAVCDPADYGRVLEAVASPEGVTAELRRELAGKVFARTAAYDAAIAAWFGAGAPLRYGENPHQAAAFVRDVPAPEEANLASARILHGKEMSYNNYVDGDAALETACELADAPAAVIVKHTNPCGAATGATPAEALAAAWEGDAVSAYGSVIALTRRVDLAAAEVLKGRFVEAVVAPGFEDDALEFLRAKSKNIRLISLDRDLAPAAPGSLRTRRIRGGLLRQTADAGAEEGWQTVTRAAFPEALRPVAEFGIRMGKHLKSNAIVLAFEHAPGRYAILGMGAGQPNRVDALRKLAIPKAMENIERLGLDRDAVLAKTVLVSDAFFPFADNVEAAAAAGIRYLVEPGGSKQDGACIGAADAAGLAMVFTGVRHFLH